MASASVSELVIFIAAVSVAAAVSGALVTTVSDISNSVDERGADVASDLDTDIEIISNPGTGAVYDDGTDDVRLLVKNTGRRQISTSGSTVDVLVDGQYIPRSSYSITVIDGSDWEDGSVARIVVDESLSTGDHRATVVVRSERETLRFRV